MYHKLCTAQINVQTQKIAYIPCIECPHQTEISYDRLVTALGRLGPEHQSTGHTPHGAVPPGGLGGTGHAREWPGVDLETGQTFTQDWQVSVLDQPIHL